MLTHSLVGSTVANGTTDFKHVDRGGMRQLQRKHQQQASQAVQEKEEGERERGRKVGEERAEGDEEGEERRENSKGEGEVVRDMESEKVDEGGGQQGEERVCRGREGLG